MPYAVELMYQHVIAMLLVFLLAGCVTTQPLVPKFEQAEFMQPLPLQLLVQVQQQDTEDFVLVIQPQATAQWRFSLFTPLGVPVARQILHQGRFTAEGLLPPNPQARQWFAALVFALMDEQQAMQLYPQAEFATQQRSLAGHWKVDYLDSNKLVIYVDEQQKINVQHLP